MSWDGGPPSGSLSWSSSAQAWATLTGLEGPVRGVLLSGALELVGVPAFGIAESDAVEDAASEEAPLAVGSSTGGVTDLKHGDA